MKYKKEQVGTTQKSNAFVDENLITIFISSSVLKIVSSEKNKGHNILGQQILGLEKFISSKN